MPCDTGEAAPGASSEPGAAPESAAAPPPPPPDGRGGGPGGDSDAAGPRARTADLAQRATSLVEQAVGILEEEIAAGIVAARRAEERLLGQRPRGAEANELLQRFRKDAHEVVDLLIDLTGAAANLLGNLARDVVRLRADLPEPANLERPPGAGSVAILTVPRVLLPGQSGQVTLSVDNDGDREVGPIAFSASGLFSAAGETIPAAGVAFEPERLTVPPGGTALLRVGVSVPPDTPAGEYSGLVQSRELPQSRALLCVHVGGA